MSSFRLKVAATVLIACTTQVEAQDHGSLTNREPPEVVILNPGPLNQQGARVRESRTNTPTTPPSQTTHTTQRKNTTANVWKQKKVELNLKPLHKSAIDALSTELPIDPRLHTRFRSVLARVNDSSFSFVVKIARYQELESAHDFSRSTNNTSTQSAFTNVRNYAQSNNLKSLSHEEAIAFMASSTESGQKRHVMIIVHEEHALYSDDTTALNFYLMHNMPTLHPDTLIVFKD